MRFKLARKREFRLLAILSVMFALTCASVVVFGDPDKITSNGRVLYRGDEGFKDALKLIQRSFVLFTILYAAAGGVCAWIGFRKTRPDSTGSTTSKDNTEKKEALIFKNAEAERPNCGKANISPHRFIPLIIISVMLLALTFASVFVFGDPDKITLNGRVMYRGDEGFKDALKLIQRSFVLFTILYAAAGTVLAWIGFRKKTKSPTQSNLQSQKTEQRRQSLRMQQLAGQAGVKADISPNKLIVVVWTLLACQFILPIPMINPFGLIIAGTIFCIRLLMHPEPIAKINGVIVLVLQFRPLYIILLSLQASSSP